MPGGPQGPDEVGGAAVHAVGLRRVAQVAHGEPGRLEAQVAVEPGALDEGRQDDEAGAQRAALVGSRSWPNIIDRACGCTVNCSRLRVSL